LSTTLIVNEHVAVFPLPSVALYVAEYDPCARSDPLDGPCVCTIDGETPLLSVPVTVGCTYDTAWHCPGVVFTVWVPGHVMTGDVLSLMVTVNEHVAVSPAASVIL
jgi:hypothetical protein